MAEPIRIAQVLNRMDSGGVEAVVMNYYRAIDRSKVQFDFYFEDKSTFPQRQELERMGAGIYKLPSYKRLISYYLTLYKALKARRYQIMHAQMSTLSFFPLFIGWCAGVPVRICHAHTTAVRSEGIKTIFKVILRPLCKLFSTEWFACGEAAGRWMYGSKALKEHKVQIVPNGIDLVQYAFDPGARRSVRRLVGIPQDAFVVGHVGRFVYQKNHAFLLDVFQRLNQKIPNSYLLLFGGGDLQSAVRDQVEKMGLAGRVIFAGVRNDVFKCYSAMDVFCLPSFYEGVPVVAIEAQANGLPCLCGEAVSREAAMTTRFYRLPLDQGLNEWVEWLCKISAQRTFGPVRERKPGLWDIRVCAPQLQSWYESHADTPLADLNTTGC